MPSPDLQPAFLVRPSLAPTESIRSLIHRLAVQNKLPLRMLGEPGRLGEATQVACELASKADWDPCDLVQRAASTSESDPSDTFVRIGTAMLGKRCIVGLQRRICPLCMVSTTWTPIDWEIRQNDACHIHQCILADKCSACGAGVAWLSHQHACDRCGLAWSNFDARPASPSSSMFAKWTHSSVVRALRGIQQDGRSKSNGVRVRLEKLLLMLEVLRCEVLRQWLTPKLWADFGHVWSIQLLKDSDYRSWLWSEMFLHAAKDPMTLEKALRPMGSALMTSAYFNGFASSAPVPSFILTALKKLGEDKLLHRLASRPVFDVRRHGIYGVFQAPEPLLSPPRHRDDKGWDDEDGQQSELDRFLEVC